MAQRRVTFSLDSSILERFREVSKKHKMTQSRIIQDYLDLIVPMLEEESPNLMMSKVLKRMAREVESTASLFENMEHEKNIEYDKSVEDYKEKKRG